MHKIIEGVTSTAGMGKGMVDDGPSGFMGGMEGYGSRNKSWATKLGFKVMDYILSVDPDSLPPNKD